ncbi:endonuclease domain-containing protein [Microbacterium yannicii]|uniref:endonuclease domain-containing protein n=1 Tax=Microbacterium yannicii TaxID=671622 RepID=UPI0012F7B5DF|nr:hypothetical protein [Microbacterium yannicii]
MRVMISCMAVVSIPQTPNQRIAQEVSRLLEWISAAGGITHRRVAENAGFPVAVRRAAVASGVVRRIKRDWLASDTAPTDLLTAAENSGRLTCVSAARRRGWWMPEDAPDDTHIRLDPHASSPTSAVTTHWTQSIAPAPSFGLLDSVEDTLAHVALCLPPERAQIVWNSALKVEKLTPAGIRRVQWRSRPARDCAERASDQSDSGLETTLVVRLSGWGLPLRQQAEIFGRPVDLLIGERLVVQIDGFAHHSTSAQRSKDVAFDAELTLNGYTVLASRMRTSCTTSIPSSGRSLALSPRVRTSPLEFSAEASWMARVRKPDLRGISGVNQPPAPESGGKSGFRSQLDPQDGMTDAPARRVSAGPGHRKPGVRPATRARRRAAWRTDRRRR